jgi:hypothetical protein
MEHIKMPKTFGPSRQEQVRYVYRFAPEHSSPGALFEFTTINPISSKTKKKHSRGKCGNASKKMSRLKYQNE